jgi:hypothetical protein
VGAQVKSSITSLIVGLLLLLSCANGSAESYVCSGTKTSYVDEVLSIPVLYVGSIPVYNIKFKTSFDSNAGGTLILKQYYDYPQSAVQKCAAPQNTLKPTSLDLHMTSVWVDYVDRADNVKLLLTFQNEDVHVGSSIRFLLH